MPYMHVSSSAYDMYPPPHMTSIYTYKQSHTCMYPPPHMTCILLRI